MVKKAKTAGQHLDNAIEKTKHHVKKSANALKKQTASLKEKSRSMKKPALPKINKSYLYIGGAVILLLLLILLWPFGGEKATVEQAQDIAKMLAADEVPIRGIEVQKNSYVITYAAEDAVGRFDDALIYDWGMIYGTAAAHDCERVSIITTLADEALHKQSVKCEAVRAFVRGVFTEEEFWLLVEHESLE